MKTSNLFGGVGMNLGDRSKELSRFKYGRRKSQYIGVLSWPPPLGTEVQSRWDVLGSRKNVQNHLPKDGQGEASTHCLPYPIG